MQPDTPDPPSDVNPVARGAKDRSNRWPWFIGVAVALWFVPIPIEELPVFPGVLFGLGPTALLVFGIVQYVRAPRLPGVELDQNAQIARADRRKAPSIWLLVVGVVVGCVSAWDVVWYVPRFCAEEPGCIPVEVVFTYPGLAFGFATLVWAPVRFWMAHQEAVRLRAGADTGRPDREN